MRLLRAAVAARTVATLEEDDYVVLGFCDEKCRNAYVEGEAAE